MLTSKIVFVFEYVKLKENIHICLDGNAQCHIAVDNVTIKVNLPHTHFIKQDKVRCPCHRS